ncbi:MAG: type 1 glutamine amidotransferase [Gammaproteobacteria bacterium]|nr:type 1 glutamine amidotransferase [Gammaproteobacteria bacterium]
MKLLIIESNSPTRVNMARSSGKKTAAEQYGDCLQTLDQRVQFDIIEPYQHTFSVQETDYSQYQGAVFTGAGVSWGVDDPEAAPLRAAMAQCFDAGLPCFGSCNGMQLAAQVLGGQNGPNPNGLEIGFAREIALTVDGRDHPMMRGKTTNFAALCVHRDHVVTLPSEATLIATNAHSPVQAFVYEKGKIKFWGTQYHPELEPQHIIDYINEPSGLFAEGESLLGALADCQAQPSADSLAQLGIQVNDIHRPHHTLELKNWLQTLS